MIGHVNESDEVMHIVLYVFSDMLRVEQIVYQLQDVEVQMEDIMWVVQQMPCYVASEHRQEQYTKNVDDSIAGGGVVKMVEIQLIVVHIKHNSLIHVIEIHHHDLG